MAVQYEYTWFDEEIASAILPCKKRRGLMRGGPLAIRVRGSSPVSPGEKIIGSGKL